MGMACPVASPVVYPSIVIRRAAVRSDLLHFWYAGIVFACERQGGTSVLVFR